MSSSARVISRVLTCLMHRCQFSIYQQTGIIPTSITPLAHQDNLIVLCYSYHAAFDHNPPYWIMLPPVKTIQQYIVHERQDYTGCTRAGLRGVSQIYNKLKHRPNHKSNHKSNIRKYTPKTFQSHDGWVGC